MHYNGPVIRPQTGADSVFIEVTVRLYVTTAVPFCQFLRWISISRGDNAAGAG